MNHKVDFRTLKSYAYQAVYWSTEILAPGAAAQAIGRRITSDGLHDSLRLVSGNLQERLKKRAVKTVTNLSKYFRKMDKSGDGLLNKDELRAALHEFRLELPEEVSEHLFAFCLSHPSRS